jgi:aromatic ring-opening dioxygenase LigB subunit
MTDQELQNVADVLKKLIPDTKDRITLINKCVLSFYRWDEDGFMGHSSIAIKYRNELAAILAEYENDRR